MSILFHDIIYGPVKSRRFGYSLGLNLLPTQSKICSFNCVYCECGWNPDVSNGFFVDKNDFFQALENTLTNLKQQSASLDVLTYAGNGEPTLHPDFLEIVKETTILRDNYFPKKDLVLLSNASTLSNKNIQEAITYIEKPVLKLDSAIEKTMRAINLPSSAFNFQKYLENLTMFPNKTIIQTMLLKGTHKNILIDNTTNLEIDALIEQYIIIQPKYVMLYSLDRIPPLSSLVKIDSDKMQAIADKISDAGIKVSWV